MVRIVREKPREKHTIDTEREGPSKHKGVGNGTGCCGGFSDNALFIGFLLTERHRWSSAGDRGMPKSGAHEVVSPSGGYSRRAWRGSRITKCTWKTSRVWVFNFISSWKELQYVYRGEGQRRVKKGNFRRPRGVYCWITFFEELTGHENSQGTWRNQLLDKRGRMGNIDKFIGTGKERNLRVHS